MSNPVQRVWCFSTICGSSAMPITRDLDGQLHESRELNLGVSIGGEVATQEGPDLEALLELAEQAMYQNKRERKQLESTAS